MVTRRVVQKEGEGGGREEGSPYKEDPHCAGGANSKRDPRASKCEKENLIAPPLPRYFTGNLG